MNMQMYMHMRMSMHMSHAHAHAHAHVCQAAHLTAIAAALKLADVSMPGGAKRRFAYTNVRSHWLHNVQSSG